MSVSSLKHLSLQFVAINFWNYQEFLSRKNVYLPMPIAEEILEAINELHDGLNEIDIKRLSKSKIRFQKLIINGKKIKNLKLLRFLKFHRIEDLEITDLTVAKALKDIKQISNLSCLKKLSLCCLRKSFYLPNQTCKYFKKLTILELKGIEIDSDTFQTICDEIKHLEELVVMELEELSHNYDYQMNRKCSESGKAVYEDKMDMYLFKDLRKLKSLKKLFITFYKRNPSWLYGFEEFFFDNHNNIQEILFVTSTTDVEWLSEMKNRFKYIFYLIIINLQKFFLRFYILDFF